jgi:hypothetical protein
MSFGIYIVGFLILIAGLIYYYYVMYYGLRDILALVPQ